MGEVRLGFAFCFRLYTLLGRRWGLLQKALRQRSDSKTKFVLDMVTVEEEEAVEMKDGSAVK